MTPYRLTLSLRSPFARRVRLALRRLEVPFEEDVINVFEPPAWFFERNPLGLVPVLTTPRGLHLPDSGSILEHLEEGWGRRIWPTDPQLRQDVRVASTFATGVMTAAVAHHLETVRDKPEQASLGEHRETIERALAWARDTGLQGEPWMVGGELTQAGWDLAVALEYLDLRLPALNWRALDSRFEKVVEAARRLEFFRKTTPPPA